MNKYNYGLDMNQEDTLPKIIREIKDNSYILEVGAAWGRMTKYLSEEKKCRVDIIELDYESGVEAAQYAERACIGEDGNIEGDRWRETLKGTQYDYIIFADVIEHLRNPESVLEKCKSYMKPNGKLIISTPNVAHNAIISNLLKNEFEYQDTGLLDSTHVKLFSYNSLRKLVQKLDMEIVHMDAVYHQIDATEFPINRDELSVTEKKMLLNHQYGDVYQFIIICQPKGLDGENTEGRVQLLSKPEHFYYIKSFWMHESDDEFSEEKSLVTWINPNETRFKIELPDTEVIKNLRITPINCNVLIKINRIEIRNKDSEKILDFITNGLLIEEKVYLFDDKEAMILIDDVHAEIHEIILEIEYLEYDNDILVAVRRKLEHEEREKREIIERTDGALRQSEARNAELSELRQSMEEEKNRLLIRQQEVEAENGRLLMHQQEVEAENGRLLMHQQEVEVENSRLSICKQELELRIAELEKCKQENEQEIKKLQEFKDYVCGLRIWKILRFLHLVRREE